ncbi:Aminoglycoside phosphotransferase [Cynara cardunculus var. scolymus]|uniref:Aminoglycoside phosphotransferase n=1 Tax=Cynara cardunculus var. scolymus TaxID=59895 RepID=A0A103YD50_CYNCS|nr:Aminoglycoside phosphotransferase [Cynara cardunculus var. scolymus]
MLSAAAASAAVASIPASVLGCATQSSSRRTIKRHRNNCRAVAGNFGHFVQVVKKDVDFLKKNISAGINWTSGVIGFPEISKKVDEFVWLRNLEDPHYSAEVQSPSWPQPYYPELSGSDLIWADLKALEAYIIYYYHLSKMWSKPLPEVFDAQEADDYFKCRPHVVALRLIEVFGSFASAAIRIRIAGIKRSKNTNAGTEADEYNSQYNFGMVLKETMLNLGPTFIKVGQSLSTRPDVIGFQVSKALSELHDQIPPFPRSLAIKIIEEELGAPVETFFSYISEEAIAAASFGQVYRANTVDGLDVAVKVQRPNLRHVVFRDIYIMRVGLDLLQQVTKRKSDLRLYADELGKGLVGELDYTLEAANAAEFMVIFIKFDEVTSTIWHLILDCLEAHSLFSFIRVPKVFQHLTQKRVLTMEWMAGESPKELLSMCSSNFEHESQYSEKQRIDAKRHLLDLVNKGVEACLVQLIETGLLHADPHPGNMLYLPSGQIGFLDFGLICRMEKKHKFAMLASIIHIVNADWASLVESLAEMDVVRPGTNISRVTMVIPPSSNLILEMENSMDEIELKDGIPDIRFSRPTSAECFLPSSLLLPPTPPLDHPHWLALVASSDTLVPLENPADPKPPLTALWSYPYPFMDDSEEGTSSYVFALVAVLEDATRVLGKVWAIALKYHFRMPPYYTLLLRSLASFEGLAMAGDPNFKTFEDSYPYVVRKLLTDNSLDTRKILHSVVLNKKKELRWEKVAFFLRIGATSKGLHLAATSRTSTEYSFNGPSRVSDTINLVLKLLLSKDGVVVRRLLMTADGASLIRGIVSKEAGPFRQQLCRMIADVVYQSICAALGNTFMIARNRAIYRSSSTLAIDYQSLVRNRRLKVILLKVLESGRKDPILMMRLCWVSFVTLIAASALACHRVLISLSEDFLDRLSLASKKLAVST